MQAPNIASAVALTSLLFVVPALGSEPPTDEGALLPGTTLAVELKLDAFYLLHGERDSDAAFLGLAEASVDVDTQAAGLWRGGHFYASVHGLGGDSVAELALVFQGIDNIEAADRFGRYECWLEQRFGKHVSLLAGYHDYNSEFDVIESAAELINPSFGIAPDISQFAPSIYPETHLGARLRVTPSANTYIQAVAYKNLPFSFGDASLFPDQRGTFFGGEVGWALERNGKRTKIAAGLWQYSVETGNQAKVWDEDPTGQYVLAEHEFTTHNGRRIALFVRLGKSNTDLLAVRPYNGGGIRIAAPLPSRPDDIVSVGFAHATGVLGSDRAFDDSNSCETIWEITWLWQLTGNVAIQPDFQYVRNPSGLEDIENSALAGLRIIVSY